MKKSQRLLILTSLAAAAVLLACSTPGVAEDSQEVELKTYSVPHGFESEVRSMLRTALGTDENRVGRASLGPAGKLLVVAPPGVQEGVAALIRELGELDSPPPPPIPVNMTFWLVVGEPLDPATMKSGEYSVKGHNLGDVAPALEQISQTQGPQEFELLERLRLSSTGDDWARVRGLHVQIEQRASAVQDSVVADLRILMQQYSLNTQVKLRPGQFVVLGQSGYEQGELALYYVITSELE